MATRTRRKKGITLDLSDYDPEGADFGGSGGFHIPPGNYGMKCESIEQKESKSSGNEMLEWVFTGTTGKAKGKKFYYYTVLDEPQKLGKTLQALGMEVEPGEFDLDTDELIDAECIGVVEDDEYNGQERSKLQRVLSADEAEEDDEEEEAPRGRTRRARGNGAAKKKVAKLSEDEIKELDEEELEDLIGKHELEVDLSKAKTLSKKRNAVLEAMAEADLIG